jgi:glycosyltransferase involved in cell wall biosynthesis
MKEIFLAPAIVSCYISRKTINRTINSFLSQTWQNIEFIIVNCSSNNSATTQIINSKSTTLNIKFYSQSNRGLTSEGNNGVRISNEKLVMPDLLFNKFGYIFAQHRKKHSGSQKLFNLLTIHKKSKNSDSNRKLLIYFVLDFVFSMFPLKVWHSSYPSLMKTIRN